MAVCHKLGHACLQHVKDGLRDRGIYHLAPQHATLINAQHQQLGASCAPGQPLIKPTQCCPERHAWCWKHLAILVQGTLITSCTLSHCTAQLLRECS